MSCEVLDQSGSRVNCPRLFLEAKGVTMEGWAMCLRRLRTRTSMILEMHGRRDMGLWAVGSPGFGMGTTVATFHEVTSSPCS